jgi:hypothetical protein
VYSGVYGQKKKPTRIGRPAQGFTGG